MLDPEAKENRELFDFIPGSILKDRMEYNQQYLEYVKLTIGY